MACPALSSFDKRTGLLATSVQLRQKDRPFGYLAALLGFNRLKRRIEIKGQAFWLHFGYSTCRNRCIKRPVRPEACQKACPVAGPDHPWDPFPVDRLWLGSHGDRCCGNY
jgi:hypothetical protein